jgi:hypothetical protein
MGAPDVLGHLRALGLTLAAEGSNIIVRPRQALTDEARQLIKAHKAELLAALRPTSPEETGNNRTEAAPTLGRYALAVDQDASHEHVTVTMTIRGALPDGSAVSFELTIPREKYDPFALLAMVERYGGTVH